MLHEFAGYDRWKRTDDAGDDEPRYPLHDIVDGLCVCGAWHYGYDIVVCNHGLVCWCDPGVPAWAVELVNG